MPKLLQLSYHIAILLIIHLAATQLANAQVFRGGLALGANFSQIDGDNAGGYSKIGLNFGAIGEINVADNWSVALELLYSQKGSRARFSANNPLDFKIILDYAEVPILVKFTDPKGGMTFGAGISYARLVNNKYEEIGISQPFPTCLEPLKNSDVSFITDISYIINNTWGFNGRFGYSILPIRKGCPDSLYRDNSQFSHYLSFRTFVLLNTLFVK